MEIYETSMRSLSEYEALLERGFVVTPDLVNGIEHTTGHIGILRKYYRFDQHVWNSKFADRYVIFLLQNHTNVRMTGLTRRQLAVSILLSMHRDTINRYFVPHAQIIASALDRGGQLYFTEYDVRVRDFAFVSESILAFLAFLDFDYNICIANDFSLIRSRDNEFHAQLDAVYGLIEKYLSRPMQIMCAHLPMYRRITHNRHKWYGIDEKD